MAGAGGCYDKEDDGTAGQRSSARAAVVGEQWRLAGGRQWQGGEKEAGVSDGWQPWLVTGVGGRAAVAGPIGGDRTTGDKRPEQQGRVGGLRQWVEAAIAREVVTEAALEEKGRWWSMAGAGEEEGVRR
ncbi:hypothetical protein B296_00023644 [Ensete ventricosum]|uniref:Uncharacterized protein n=1 Tax=Ensete ventricosum TaxID=4639 RepID=A0A426WZ72_ENSVE|nr:hypothetical protein B296_00023644 [Ensete ventricosum]